MAILTDPLVVAAAIAAAPAIIAAVLSHIGNRRTKETVVLAKDNADKLDHISNGMIDQKIKDAVKEILEEQSINTTEVIITEVLGKILQTHLEEGS